MDLALMSTRCSTRHLLCLCRWYTDRRVRRVQAVDAHSQIFQARVESARGVRAERKAESKIKEDGTAVGDVIVCTLFFAAREGVRVVPRCALDVRHGCNFRVPATLRRA